MTKGIVCDPEFFSISMNGLLSEVEDDIADGLSKEIPRLAKKGAKSLRDEAGKHWDGKTGSAYVKGFTFKRIKTGKVTTAEIGNKRFPGLVHLLEKGHATLTGRRARAIPHVKPVYEELEPEIIESIDRVVDRALEG